MKWPAKMPRGVPRILKTDRLEIRIHNESGVIQFYGRTIYLGEIVTRKTPMFTFRVADYLDYLDVLDIIIATLAAWRDKCKNMTPPKRK